MTMSLHFKNSFSRSLRKITIQNLKNGENETIEYTLKKELSYEGANYPSGACSIT